MVQEYIILLSNFKFNVNAVLLGGFNQMNYLILINVFLVFIVIMEIFQKF